MDLKELLGEEMYAQVMEKLGDKCKIGIISDGSYIPKAKFDELNEEKKQLKEQVKTHEQQLETLSKAAKGNEELQAKITALQEENEKATKEHQEKMDKLSFDHSLSNALIKAKAKNPKAVNALLDTAKIKLDGEKLLGLEDQLEALKKSDPYLFDEETGGGGANPAGGGGSIITNNPYAKATFNLTEQMKLEKSNPALAVQYAAAAGIK